MRKLLAMLMMLMFALSGCGGEKASQPSQSPSKVEQVASAPVEEKKSYSNGQFKVGVDLPAGEYLAVGTGYVEVASAPELTAIIYNDNIENAQRYVGVRDGEYVKVEHALKLYALADAPKISVQGKIPDGQFKVGSDISAGEYKITLNAGGYFAVTSSPRNDFVTNQFTNEGGTYYATVADGQYLQIKKGSAEAVTAAASQVKQPAAETKSAFDTAPARISTLPSIGATRAEFDASYTATNKNGVGYIRYNQDVWHAQFLNANWDDSDDKNARAYMVMVQVLPGLPLSMTGIEDLIPADAENVQYDSSGSDKVVTVRNFTGTSEQIKAIFPHSNGKFGGGFNWDAATGKFIGGTIMVEYPFPPSKK